MKNPEVYLSNPVNAYLMVKRFTADWEDAVKIHFNDYSLQSTLC